MCVKDLRITAVPALSSNSRVEGEFMTMIFSRVKKTRHSRSPNVILFRPQSRPKEEFDGIVAPLLDKEQYSRDVILVSITNNKEKSDAYLDDYEYRFKMRVKMVLVEGSLRVDQNEEAFLKLSRTLIADYGFKDFKEDQGTDSGADAGEDVAECNNKMEEIRILLKKVQQPVTMVILNDARSEYTNSLLSALDDAKVPHQPRDVLFQAYAWEDLWIIGLGSTENVALAEGMLDLVSRNRKLVIVVVQMRGSTSDLEELKMKMKSKSRSEEASWHIVVAMDTLADCTEGSSNFKTELQRVSDENKIQTNQIHFVKNNIEEQKDSKRNNKHLTVLRDIIASIEPVVEQARRRWFAYVLVGMAAVVALSSTVYARSFLEDVLDMSWVVLSGCDNLIQTICDCVHGSYLGIGSWFDKVMGTVTDGSFSYT